MTDVQLYHGDALAVLRTLDTASVDAIVCDPPAGIEFMGKSWDSPAGWAKAHSGFGFREGVGVGGVTDNRMTRNPNCKRCRKHIRGSKGCRCPQGPDSDEDDAFGGRARVRQREAFIAFLSAVFTEARRVIKPGGYALVWAIPRTSHWTATALEDAGWEIRDRVSELLAAEPLVGAFLDSLMPEQRGAFERAVGGAGRLAHVFGTGFPKAKSCLKPACEDWWLCRAPGNGVRPLGIDECRVAYCSDADFESAKGGDSASNSGGEFLASKGALRQSDKITPAGRWPANVVLSHIPPDEYGNGGCVPCGTVAVGAGLRKTNQADEVTGEHVHEGYKRPGRSCLTHKIPGQTRNFGMEEVEAWACHPECPVRLLDEQAGPQKSGGTPPRRPPTSAKTKNSYGDFTGEENPNGIGSSTGNVSRFFYCPKASRSDRGLVGVRAMKMRDDLTPEQRAFVLAELQKAGVSL